MSVGKEPSESAGQLFFPSARVIAHPVSGSQRRGTTRATRGLAWKCSWNPLFLGLNPRNRCIEADGHFSSNTCRIRRSSVINEGIVIEGMELRGWRRRGLDFEQRWKDSSEGLFLLREKSIIALLGRIIRRNLREKVIPPFRRDSSIWRFQFRECPIEGATRQRCTTHHNPMGCPRRSWRRVTPNKSCLV